MNPSDLREDSLLIERHEAAGYTDDLAAPAADASRRSFLRRGAAVGGGVAVASVFDSFLGRAAFGQAPGPGYGPLAEVIDPATGLPLLRLPAGFEYMSFGWTGDPLTGGAGTPGAHDGMAVIPVGGDRIVLIRNHERGAGSSFRAPIYDPRAAGGTTNILFNLATGQVERQWASLSGTIRNCAGGLTPWGTWLTCEENTSTPTNPVGTGITKTHGWIFEVPALGWTAPVPLRDMGRFSHEAVAVDPATGFVYETQDQTTASGFYRFIPTVPGNLRRGGTLQMLVATTGAPPVVASDLSGPLPVGSTFDVQWVTIPNPALDGITGNTAIANGVFNQGFAQGGARFFRLEGCWYGNGLVYFDDTGGGASGHFGQIWEFDPALQTLRLIFSSGGRATLDQPDNLAVSPRSGGLILCEDGSNDVQRMQGLTTAGTIFEFAENNIIIPATGNPKPLIAPGSYTDFEWCGATFATSSTGVQWLFANVQTPGVTFAIRGPWANGGL